MCENNCVFWMCVKNTFELLHGKPPFIEHLKAFGCLRFASILPKGDKFWKRAKQGVLLGYYSTQKIDF